MTEALPLTAFYSGWGRYQQSLVDVIAPLSPAQLALRPVPHHWSIGMIAQHIVANRVWWFHGWLGEGNDDLMAIAHWDPRYDEEQPLREPAELITGLEATWQMIANALAHWTTADLEHVFLPAAFLSEEEQRMVGERTLHGFSGMFMRTRFTTGESFHWPSASMDWRACTAPCRPRLHGAAHRKGRMLAPLHTVDGSLRRQ